MRVMLVAAHPSRYLAARIAGAVVTGLGLIVLVGWPTT
jgi:hypothetical protein